VLFGCEPDRTQNARQAGRVGHRHVGEILGPEPAKIVVLVGCGVDRFPVPARDEEGVHVEGVVDDRHRDFSGVVDVDAELLEAFATNGLMGQRVRGTMAAPQARMRLRGERASTD